MEATRRLRIATWNCFGAVASFGGLLMARPRWPERFAHPCIAKALSAWDIVCVQEDFLPFVTTALEDAAHEARMHLWTAMNQEENHSLVGSGLAILSRHAPVSVRFTPFTGRTHGFDGLAGKGFAIAEFETGGGARFCVVNTHLQADDPSFGIEQSQTVRGEQLRSMLAALEAGTPTVIAGDLNVPYGSRDHATHLAPLLAEFSMRDQAEGTSFITYDPVSNDLLRALGPTEPPSRLDYVLTIDGTKSQWARTAAPTLILHEPLDEVLENGRGRVFPSDHYGLGVGLSLNSQSQES